MNLARMYMVAGVTGLLCYTFYNSVPITERYRH